MENNKLDCMGNYYGTRVGRLQILYLKEKLRLSIATISSITGYAYATIKNYLRKYKELIAEALELFFYKAKKKIEHNNDSQVFWECECPADEIPCAYVSEIYDNDTRLFLKIGYSSHVEDRMHAHAMNSRYGGDFVKVKKVYAFNSEEQALSMENLLRKYYKEKNNCADFIKNDRFIEQIPTEEDFQNFSNKAQFILDNF